MSESTTPPKPEMFDEINALFGTVAGAFKLDADALVMALDSGAMTLEMGQDEDGARSVAPTYTQHGESRTCRIFKDGIHDESEDPSDRPKG